MSAGRDLSVLEAAVSLVVSLSEGQVARARKRDSLTQVPGWTIADLEAALERRQPGIIAEVRKAIREATP